MKKILLFLLLLSGYAKAQFPVTQYLGSGKTLVVGRGGLAVDSGLVFRHNFADSNAANAGFLKNIPNIVVSINDSLWKRNNSATGWIRLSGLNVLSPLVYSGGVLSLGTVPISKGGTGLTSVGLSGKVLRSNGTGLQYVYPFNADSLYYYADPRYEFKHDSIIYESPLELVYYDDTTNKLVVHYETPTWNANKFQGYDIDPGEPEDGDTWIYNRSLHRWEYGPGGRPMAISGFFNSSNVLTLLLFSMWGYYHYRNRRLV